MACVAYVGSCLSLRACLDLVATFGCTAVTLVLQPHAPYSGANNTDIRLPTPAGVTYLELVGNAATVDAGGETRHFHVTQLASLNVTNVTLRSGRADRAEGEANQALLGGSIFLWNARSFHASQVTFDSNRAGPRMELGPTTHPFGGAIGANLGAGSFFGLDDCVFTNNSATGDSDATALVTAGRGGALYLQSTAADPPRCIFVRCNFLDNSAHPGSQQQGGPEAQGGAVQITHTGPMILDFISCTWRGNVAYGTQAATMSGPGAWGGALAINGGPNASFQDCSFASNHAEAGSRSSGAGGAVTIQDRGDSPARVSFTRCAFTYNTATFSSSGVPTYPSRGGAVFVVFFASTQIAIDDCHFANNLADDGQGGALMFASFSFDTPEPGVDGLITLVRSTFERNKASYGGSLWLGEGSAVVENCTLTDNTASSLTGRVSSALPRLAQGGAFSWIATELSVLSRPPYLIINGSHFVGNQAIMGASDTRPIARGGAGYMKATLRSPPVLILDSTFVGNSVSGGTDCLVPDGGGGGALSTNTIGIYLLGTQLIDNMVGGQSLGTALMATGNVSNIRLMDSDDSTCAVVQNHVNGPPLCDTSLNMHDGPGSVGTQIFFSSAQTILNSSCLAISISCAYALDCAQCVANATCGWVPGKEYCTSEAGIGLQECPVGGGAGTPFELPWWAWALIAVSCCAVSCCAAIIRYQQRKRAKKADQLRQVSLYQEATAASNAAAAASAAETEARNAAAAASAAETEAHMEVQRKQGVKTEMLPVIKAATVRIGMLDKHTKKLIKSSIGSGTIIDAGAGKPKNQILTSAHMFVDHRTHLKKRVNKKAVYEDNPTFRQPWWQIAAHADPGPANSTSASSTAASTSASNAAASSSASSWTWTADDAPIIIAIGVYDSSQPDGPSTWKYWAEIVTPLDVLKELTEAPDPPYAKNQLLDLAVLRICGYLDLTSSPPPGTSSAPPPRWLPNAYHGADVEYTSIDKKPASEVSLPRGVCLHPQPDLLEVGGDVVNLFGWYSEQNEVTLFSPHPKMIMAISKGMLTHEVHLASGGSGGPTCDHEGRVVGVNSMSCPASRLFQGESYKAYSRMVSMLKDEHGLDYEKQSAAPAASTSVAGGAAPAVAASSGIAYASLGGRDPQVVPSGFMGLFSRRRLSRDDAAMSHAIEATEPESLRRSSGFVGQRHSGTDFGGVRATLLRVRE